MVLWVHGFETIVQVQDAIPWMKLFVPDRHNLVHSVTTDRVDNVLVALQELLYEQLLDPASKVTVAAGIGTEYALGLLEAVHFVHALAARPLEDLEDDRVGRGQRRIQRLQVRFRLAPRGDDLLVDSAEPSLTHGLAHDPLVASGLRQRPLGRVPPYSYTSRELVRQVHRRVVRRDDSPDRNAQAQQLGADAFGGSGVVRRRRVKGEVPVDLGVALFARGCSPKTCHDLDDFVLLQ
mmetsp:Transcript_95580/g.252515  ORF Transcript_95580/g.252515 Transcript_95580/m.252515 type:complete len:236 (+) Transcript_95580:1330-2037(+)